MNVMVGNATQAAVLKVVAVDSPDLSSLDDFRHRLADLPHCAATVGDAGMDWLCASLDRNVIETLRGFANSRHKALLLRGFPLSTDVATPRNGFLPNSQCILDFDLLHFGMLRLLGIQPHAVEYENEGKLVRNVVPVPEASNTTSSWGAEIEFSWHTDNPNWPFASGTQEVTACVPNFLAFTAVRNHEGASTDIVCVDRVIEQLPDWAVEQLQQAAYTFGAPASNEGFDGETRIFPILEHSERGYRLRFDDGIVAALDPLSEAALTLLRQCLRDVKGIEVVLQPGDFFIFKNAQVLHRRRAFKPFHDGKARWLRRVYGS